jgi:PIN domain nuclease of toxin-antitoxin system
VSRYLVDTHVWLWLQAEPERLTPTVRDLVEEPANELLLSAASAWEIAIKYTLGKLPLPQQPTVYVLDRMRRSGTRPLAIEHAHVLRTSELPDHHRDPFDRLLVAQAQILDIAILTVDDQIAAYDVKVIRA